MPAKVRDVVQPAATDAISSVLTQTSDVNTGRHHHSVSGVTSQPQSHHRRGSSTVAATTGETNVDTLPNGEHVREVVAISSPSSDSVSKNVTPLPLNDVNPGAAACSSASSSAASLLPSSSQVARSSLSSNSYSTTTRPSGSLSTRAVSVHL